MKMRNEEFAHRYLSYVKVGDLEGAYFWWVAYCWGREQAIREIYGPQARKLFIE